VVKPQPFTWNAVSVSKVYDEFTRSMDERYSYFFLKTNVQWHRLVELHRPKAVTAKNRDELASTLKELLAPLKDLHIWIETPNETIPTFSSSFGMNANAKATHAEIEPIKRLGNFALVGKTRKDGFGYLLLLRQTAATPPLVRETIEVMTNLFPQVPAFMVDLRGANGGSEPLAQEIAQLFCASNTLYALSKYRNGPSHTNFTPANPRVLAGFPQTPFTKPVVCLIGPGTVSSGEGFAKMMKALPHLTLVGLPTRGASGNPKPHELTGTGLTVKFSSWVDMLPDGTVTEGVGVQPDVRVDLPQAAYEKSDPTLEKALELLFRKTGTVQ
jgi:C-terminal processing protease CtpA/Prc